MDHGQSKSSGSREVSKKGRPLGLVVALAAAGGAVIGSAVTYIAFKPLDATKLSTSPAAGATSQVQTLAVPTMPSQQQYTPGPQPPGEAPPGKVWSAEHGHWHDAPVTVTPVPAPTVPGTTPASSPPAVAPAVPTTATPPATPAEKKQ